MEHVQSAQFHIIKQNKKGNPFMNRHSNPKPNPLHKSSLPTENVITCPSCEFVYDTRFLAEQCRMIDGEGYHCFNCNTLLVSF